MTDCVLPVTGSNPSLVVVAFVALAAGLALVLGVRRRGIGGGAAVVVAFALAAAGLVIGDARRADAQECPPSTTVASTAAPTTTLRRPSRDDSDHDRVDYDCLDHDCLDHDDDLAADNPAGVPYHADDCRGPGPHPDRERTAVPDPVRAERRYLHGDGHERWQRPD